MDKRVRIPVKVVRPAEYEAALAAEDTGMRWTTGNDLERKPPAGAEVEAEQEREFAASEQVGEVATPAPEVEHELEEWRDRALRLQAEMENYRKRQQRLAQEQIEAERQRLLASFLQIVDDLERALASQDAGEKDLRRGVELTHREAMHLLQKEAVEPIEANNQAFDPNWHEAVATVGDNGSHAAPGTVVRVVEPGYRLNDRLLRPAKVVVAA